MMLPQLLLSSGRKDKPRTNVLTNFACSVDLAQPLCLVLLCPALEELFEHG